MVSAEGRCQGVDLEALKLKVLLLGGAPGVVPLTFNEPNVALHRVPVKHFFQFFLA